jgi:hypothetical protein
MIAGRKLRLYGTLEGKKTFREQIPSGNNAVFSKKEDGSMSLSIAAMKRVYNNLYALKPDLIPFIEKLKLNA